MEKISVVINTYNAEEHLREVLESVKAFDEIVVCDMESTDSTLDIAAEYGCKIVTFPKGNYNIVEPARNFAIQSASNDWVLVLDADEVVQPDLVKYLYDEIQKPNCPDGLCITRKNYFMGRFMQSFYPDYILRFFRKSLTDWPPIIHVQPNVNGRVGHIPQKRTELALEHLADESINSRISKINIYTNNELVRKADKHYGTISLLWRPFFRFFKAYILKGGIRDGKPGFIRAVYEGIYQFVLVSKMEERKRM